jgi:hypothetical protein
VIPAGSTVLAAELVVSVEVALGARRAMELHSGRKLV